jgi:type I restriction enzyme S subunit
MIRTTNVRDGFIDVSDTRFVDEEVFKTWTRRQLPKPGDVVLTREAPLGEVGIIPKGAQVFLGQRLVSYRTDPDRLNNRFLLYYLRSPAGKAQVLSFGMGATVAHMRVPDAKNLLIPTPPIEIQRRIASILGAYDDLIEVNRRRVAILEEMARGLFEDWFVRFRFPGHEGVKIEEAANGRLPAGWVQAAIGDVVRYVNRGIAPKYSDEAATLVVGQKCIRDQRLSLALARRQSKPVPADKIVQAGDVLINSTGVGTLGRVAQAEEVPPGLTVDSHVTIVRPACPTDRDYLGACLLAMQPVFEALGAGSTGQTELARTAVQGLEIIWPPESLRARYGATVRPMRELIAGLSTQAVNLASSRDLLLPRLISGQLSVEAAERELEDAA